MKVGASNIEQAHNHALAPTRREKRVTFGISIAPDLLKAVDALCSESGENRSAYIRRLITVDLVAAGKLPGSRKAEAHDRLNRLIATEGEDIALARLVVSAAESLDENAG